MRIGIDARMYRSSVAGIGQYSQNLIKNLLEIDRENQYILFMTSEDKKEFENYFIENSLKIENLKLKIVETNIPHFSIAEQVKLPKIIEKEHLDLMHFLNFNYPVKYRGKFITTIHDLTLIFYPQTAKDMNFVKHIGFRYVMKKAVKNSVKIVAVSRSTKNDLVKFYKIPESKIKVIYEAADDKSFACHPELVEGSHANAGQSETSSEILRLTPQDDRPIILCVGQFRFHKNIQGLVEAFSILKKELPCRLVMLGKKDRITSRTDEMIDNFVNSGDIITPGFVSDKDLIYWYKIASVFVFPSFYEGFGLPGLEAMMAGTPVVASNKAALPEIYQDAAIYFDPFNSADIAAKIKEVITNKKLQEKLIKNGREVLKLYSWRKTAMETLKVYNNINPPLGMHSETN